MIQLLKDLLAMPSMLREILVTLHRLQTQIAQLQMQIANTELMIADLRSEAGLDPGIEPEPAILQVVSSFDPLGL